MSSITNAPGVPEGTAPASIAVVRDYRAENWPSMDLCADQLLAHGASGITATDVAPDFVRVLGRLPAVRGFGHNADRIFNRHFLLPRTVKRAASRSEFVHIVDHSYAHLVKSVAPGQAGVYCHDLDAFQSLLEPAREPRPWWFRRLARRTLDGLQQAAVVFHNSNAVRDQLLDARLVEPEKLLHAPLGVAEEFVPLSTAAVALPFALDWPYLLHVGSNIPRKRLDVALDVFAKMRHRRPQLQIVQVGGPWPSALVDRIARLDIARAVHQVRGLDRPQLAELYRRAVAVLVTSDAEGFGLPVIEALACGVPVVASDLPVLREVGGEVVRYCAVADIRVWADTVEAVLVEAEDGAKKESRIRHAAKYSWREHARIVYDTYRQLAANRSPSRRSDR